MPEARPIEMIRILSAVCEFETDKLANRLALVNLISRGIIGDAEKEYVIDQIKKCTTFDLIWDEP